MLVKVNVFVTILRISVYMVCRFYICGSFRRPLLVEGFPLG